MSTDEFYIRWICNILKGMTLSEYFGDKKASKISGLTFKWTYPFVILSMVLFVACVFISAFSSKEFTPYLAKVLTISFSAMFIAMILYGLIIFFEISRKSWIFYKKRYDSLLDIFEWYSIKDMNFLKILSKFELSMLKFALIQYRQQWIVLRWKMYFWLVPVLPVLALDLVDIITVDLLFVGNVNIGFVKTSILFLTSFVCYIVWLRQRPKQVILLLEYIIRLKSESQKSASNLSPEHSIGLQERLGGFFK